MPRDVPYPTIPTVKELLGERYTDTLSYPFPDVQPPILATGSRLLVQLRCPGRVVKLNNGKVIHIPDESVDTDKFNVQTALVRQLASFAYRNRVTRELWIEGEWCLPGDFIRSPKYGGDRIVVPAPKVDDEPEREVHFLVINDADVVGLIPDIEKVLTIKGLL